MWTAHDIPDQRRRVAVVTGANGGLGIEVARELGRKGATVLMAARDQAKARAAQQEITTEVPDADLKLYELDLASLDSVRACAATILADHPRIDLLVNNAGVIGIPRQSTADGLEMQLGVNHLGHFVLTRHLLPALLAGRAGRVVSVTSFARYIGRAVRADDPPLPSRYETWTAYAAPSWPTCCSRWSFNGGSSMRAPRPSAWPLTPVCRTPICRRGASARPTEG